MPKTTDRSSKSRKSPAKNPQRPPAGKAAKKSRTLEQDWPGSDEELRPQADHGEETYRGSDRLNGRRALITGGDSGIGRAVALCFAREGADIAIAYFDEHEDAERTLELVRQAGRTGVAIPGDLTDREHCIEVVEQTVSELGGLDILVNNAAYQCERKDLREITDEQMERTFRTNIFANIWITQAALEHLGEGGVILNTGSVTGFDGNDTLIDYAATKGAIHALTKSLASSLADRAIRVNCVAPGPVWTPLIPATLERDHVKEFGKDTFWGRPAQPIEIATSFVFLASDEGRYYTGEVLTPTGRSTSR